ncbi:MAG: hypothetical protein V4819_16105 [Verrucomicrobiota bacterium]
MSEETVSSPEISPNPEAESAPRVRRVSTPRPKKVAKSAAPEEPAAEIPSIPFPSSAPDREEDSDAPSQAGGEWPEPESESSGGSQSQSEGGPKRKRRRRKGKGQSAGPQNGGGPATEEVYTIAAQEPAKPSEAPQPRPAPQPHQPQRPKVDPELLTKMAWKIYLAEVSEEGVALIGDNDAKDLSRRCFRLAEIFIEEQARRR